MVGHVGGGRHVVDVPVAEQDALDGEPVLLDDPDDLRGRADPRIDDHRAGAVGGEHVAVCLPRTGRKGGQEHDRHLIECWARA